MAMIYRLKDGTIKGRTDEGKIVSISTLTSKLKNYTCIFLGENRLQFNKIPTDHYKYIVIEISDKDELNSAFPNMGFYVVDDLDPSDAAFIYS